MSGYKAMLGLVFFAISMSATPGPNNIMVATFSATYGLRRTLPQILGISVGFPIMLVAVGLGIGPVFDRFPRLHAVLTLVGAMYLLYLAFKIARTPAARTDEHPSGSKPLTFLQSALFQLVNPKAWIIAVGAITTFTDSHRASLHETFTVALVFVFVTFPCVTMCATSGIAIGRILKSNAARRRFNIVMASLLVLSVALL